ncbi:hypothetical protein ABU614_06995 [Lysobacter firmicutimachus]|uniref:DUF159 family protein n=1 Tax=Lysobacter firmicutimachus TaxID=1792846 RepID=A0AAU8MVM7_9GAMM
MCYSAKVRAEYREYVREFGAVLSLDAYVAEYWEQMGDEWVKKLPKAVRAWFADPQTAEEVRVQAAIAEWEAREATKTQQDLFAQAKRLADAERALQTKVTKKAQNDLRVATNKIGQFKTKLDDLRRTEVKPRDSRIYPGSLAPVIVWEGVRKPGQSTFSAAQVDKGVLTTCSACHRTTWTTVLRVGSASPVRGGAAVPALWRRRGSGA